MSEETTLVTRQQEIETAATLYGADKDIAEFCYAVKKVAPWAQELKDNEIGLVVRRAVAMGLDPLNPHEVQIWRDKRGNIQFQIAYTMMAEWVKTYKGNHTAPIYRALTEAEKDEEGLEHDCMAFYAEFVMLDDLPYAAQLMELGYQPKEAREMVTVRGLGVSHKEEYDAMDSRGKKFFAPAGRSPAWKVKKRAMVDAYRCKFGTPNRPEIMELRRTGKLADVTVENWEEASDEMEADARVRLVEAVARERNRAEDDRAPDEVLAENSVILHGDQADQDWDAPKVNLVNRDTKRPADPATLRYWLRKRAEWVKGDAADFSDANRQPDDKQAPPDAREIQRLAAIIDNALGTPDSDLQRHSVYKFLFKRDSGKLLTVQEVQSALAAWEAESGAWTANEYATRELIAIVTEAIKEAGQQELPLGVAQ